MKDCLGLLGKIFGHNYTSVYSTNVEDEKHVEEGYDETISTGKREIIPVSTYCKRCGDTIPLGHNTVV